MSATAVKIDLSIFFHDERKMIFVLVNPNWKTVECLQKRIEFLFGVDSVRFLSDGLFLPPQESIELLKFCNNLKAFVPNESLDKKKKKKSKKYKNKEKSSEESSNEDAALAKSNEELTNASQNKRKYNSLENNINFNQAKRSKRLGTFSEISSTSEQMATPIQNLDIEINRRKSKSKLSVVTSDYEEPAQSNESHETKSQVTVTGIASNLEEISSVDKVSDNQPKSRHTTPKGNKSLENAHTNVEKTFSDETKATTSRSSNIPSSTFLSESSMQKQSIPNNPFGKASNGTHIFFTESGEMMSHKNKTVKEPKTLVIFRCPLENITNDDIETKKPRIFHLKSKNIGNEKKIKQIVEIQEEIILPSLILNCNENKELGQTTEIPKQTDEPDSLNDRTSSGNTSIATENTTIAKNDSAEGTSANNLNISSHKETNVTHSTNECNSQVSNVDESSIMSVDCVDLSIDLDEDEKLTSKTRTEKSDDIDSSSDVEEISEIIDLNESEDIGDSTENSSNTQFKITDDIKIEKILPFSTEMNELPNIGDIVVFKVSYANKQKQIVETNYLAGKAEYVNKRTKSIKILIIDGLAELYHVPSQYHCNLDDSQHYVKHVQIKLNEMIQPKLFSMS